ncbi:hypothetical protein D9M71_572360 [compost metagenome]
MREVGDAMPGQVAFQLPAFRLGTALGEVIQLAPGQAAAPGLAGFVEHFMQRPDAGLVQVVLAKHEGVAIVAFIAIPHWADIDHDDVRGA